VADAEAAAKAAVEAAEAKAEAAERAAAGADEARRAAEAEAAAAAERQAASDSDATEARRQAEAAAAELQAARDATGASSAGSGEEEVAEVVLDMDFEAVAAARSDFDAAFCRDVAASLGVDVGAVSLLSLAGGSVVARFRVGGVQGVAAQLGGGSGLSTGAMTEFNGGRCGVPPAVLCARLLSLAGVCEQAAPSSASRASVLPKVARLRSPRSPLSPSGGGSAPPRSGERGVCRSRR